MKFNWDGEEVTEGEWEVVEVGEAVEAKVAGLESERWCGGELGVLCGSTLEPEALDGRRFSKGIDGGHGGEVEEIGTRGCETSSE